MSGGSYRLGHVNCCSIRAVSIKDGLQQLEEGGDVRFVQVPLDGHANKLKCSVKCSTVSNTKTTLHDFIFVINCQITAHISFRKNH